MTTFIATTEFLKTEMIVNIIFEYEKLHIELRKRLIFQISQPPPIIMMLNNFQPTDYPQLD